MNIKKYERIQRVILPEEYGIPELTYKIIIVLYQSNFNSNCKTYNLDLIITIENKLSIRMIKEHIGQFDSVEIGKLNFDNVVKNYKRKVKENFNELLQ